MYLREKFSKAKNLMELKMFADNELDENEQAFEMGEMTFMQRLYADEQVNEVYEEFKKLFKN